MGRVNRWVRVAWPNELRGDEHDKEKKGGATETRKKTAVSRQIRLWFRMSCISRAGPGDGMLPAARQPFFSIEAL
jgi:hypothetical protein